MSNACMDQKCICTCMYEHVYEGHGTRGATFAIDLNIMILQLTTISPSQVSERKEESPQHISSHAVNNQISDAS